MVGVFARIRNELINDTFVPPSPHADNNNVMENYNYNEGVISEVIKYLENNYKDATLDGAAQNVHMSAK